MSSTTDIAYPLWTNPLHRAYLEPSHLHCAIYALLTFCSYKSNFILHNTDAIGHAASFSLILTFDFQNKICSTVFSSAVQLMTSYFWQGFIPTWVLGYSPHILTRICDTCMYILWFITPQIRFSLPHSLPPQIFALLLICSIVHLHYDPYYENSKGLQKLVHWKTHCSIHFYLFRM